MKKIVRYWVPPLLLMALMFPLTNKALGSSFVYELFMSLFKGIFPGASAALSETAYIVFRKSLHFAEYGVLAVLLYRAFRGGRTPKRKTQWVARAGAVAIGYGFLDEYLQSFAPNRTGSPLDWAVDTLGICFALAFTARWATREDAGSARFSKGSGFWKAHFLKRPFDLVLSLVGLVLSSPLWLVVSAAIWLQDRGPVFYCQERVGLDGKIFKAVKFRSMIRNAEKDSGPVQAVENDPRVTKIGRVLRASAMDELPQLWNIFKGDMSFVGPRALRPNEREVIGNPDLRSIEEIPGYRERHSVRPGLTGLTQVFLPGETPRRKKFRYDLLYIRRRSFWLDLKLIFLSFWITFRGKWESREEKV